MDTSDDSEGAPELVVEAVLGERYVYAGAVSRWLWMLRMLIEQDMHVVIWQEGAWRVYRRVAAVSALGRSLPPYPLQEHEGRMRAIDPAVRQYFRCISFVIPGVRYDGWLLQWRRM